jgi:3'-phosphoadenosine 5'-phosphosulfate sulfotransferase (PAPS reductase)/FAD synthetase
VSVEPFLRREDVRAWAAWMQAAVMRRRTLRYRNAVDEARRIVGEALARGQKPSASVSGGKDSSALAILLGELGAPVEVLSEKDDLDYPGEESYVRALCASAKLPLRILRPPVEPSVLLAARAGRMSGGEDQHGRGSAMARTCFYDVMEGAEREGGYDLGFWGLRAGESGPRQKLLHARGPLYQLQAGPWRCHPLAWWEGIDVYAFLEARGVEMLPVYRCCGWLPEHRRDPSRIRKSWWIPGVHAAKGQAAWLRHYWPSLWERWKALFPDARTYA